MPLEANNPSNINALILAWIKAPKQLKKIYEKNIYVVANAYYNILPATNKQSLGLAATGQHKSIAQQSEPIVKRNLL